MSDAPVASAARGEEAEPTAPARSRLRRVFRFLLGESPLWALACYAPTLFALGLDLAIRPRALGRLSAGMMTLYAGSAIAGAGLWGFALWMAARLFLVPEGRARLLARGALGLLFAGFFFPFACLAYGGQALYYRVFSSYISRDSVRMGIRLRGDVWAWLSSWTDGLWAMLASGAVITLIVFFLVRRAARPLAVARPILPLYLACISGFCYWTDFIETRALQAAPPDACFMHGVIHAAKVVVTGAPLRGVTLRTPAPLPPLERAERRPDVIVILSESVRADALCSSRASGCEAPFLDEVAPDRLALGKLTAQASGTFSACMMLWTGVGPSVDFDTAHRAPMLWEVARAAGYRTAYIGSQNLLYQDLGTYLKNAGIDLLLSAVDLGEAPDVHIGAPDENATARALRYAAEAPSGTPYFLLLHLSNTHWPYRVEPGLEPHEPHATGPLAGPRRAYNHYRNAVHLQERTVAAFLRGLRASPRWADTVVLFLSDHGEQFREHRRSLHLNNLFDEEVTVPGFLVAGERVLLPEQRRNVVSFAGRRTYDQDVHATVLDLFGALDQRAKLPFASLVTGRSLLRPRPPVEPMVAMSTTSSVYEDAEPVYGVRQGELMVVGGEVGKLRCFDSRVDPAQHKGVALSRCEKLVEVLGATFPEVEGARR